MARLVSIISFLFLLTLGSYAFGLYSAHSNAGPYLTFKSMVAAWEAAWRIEDDRLPPDFLEPAYRREPLATRERFARLETTGAPIVVAGGIGKFVEECGEPGCLAVVFDRTGKITRSWPLNVEAITEGEAVSESPFAYVGGDRTRDITVRSIQFFDNGDLLVSFVLRNAFPTGWGMMRVASDGSVVWRSRRYFHHWAKIGRDGMIYSPFYELRTGEIYRDGAKFSRRYAICRLPQKQYADLIAVVTPDGEIVRRIDLIDLFLKSERYNYILSRTTNRCDPLHHNFIDIAEESDVGTLPWLEAGDLLLSFRGISAIAVVSADGTELKRVFAGSFVRQHSAQFIGDGKVVLFDNMGSGPDSLPSRVLSIDLATGEETVIRARPTEDKQHAEFTTASGNIGLSDDNRRALVAYTRAGRMMELDLTTGEVLSIYEHWHDYGNQATGLYEISGAWYLP